MPAKTLLHMAGFGVRKTPEPRSEELRVIRGFTPIIGLLVALLPATAYAQTNLDRGKSASQLFSSACIECHKATHGLAKGKSAATVAQFLREHYTTSGEQAAALAAYVVAGRDTVASPVPGRKPGEHAGATAEEPSVVACCTSSFSSCSAFSSNPTQRNLRMSLTISLDAVDVCLGGISMIVLSHILAFIAPSAW
jgi:mono/diheme cytochrome c family protein